MDFLYLIKIRATNPGRTAEESGINSGNWYNSNFDKLHNVVTSSYNLNENGLWSQLCTADRTTTSFPNGQYEYLELTFQVMVYEMKTGFPPTTILIFLQH
jgi:hypothetical protein